MFHKNYWRSPGSNTQQGLAKRKVDCPLPQDHYTTEASSEVGNGVPNNKADTHPHRLISVFVVRCLHRIE